MRAVTQPPAPDQLGAPDTAGRRSKGDAFSGGRSIDTTAAAPGDIAASAAPAAAKDGRIPDGTPWSVVGLRDADLVGSPRGELARRRLAAVLGAQATMFADLVILTGLRPGAEHLGALAAADAGVPYVVVLPYPDPAAGWSPTEREWFDRGCESARDRVTLERRRPVDLEGRRAAMGRRDGWLRSVSSGAVVLTDGTDTEAESLLRRFSDSLGDDVWTLEIQPG